MKKYCFLLLIIFLTVNFGFSQTKSIRIGYIDMEYILEKIPDYANAKNQLEEKAQKWKQEIEVKKATLLKLQESLKTEKVLLTKELIDEREEEITFQTKELLDFQQKKFGPNGDLVNQKAVLVKPIQDQVFNAVQDIAEAKKYDYIFDKSSDLTILFASKRLDISDQVIRKLTQLERRQQLNKKEIKAEALKERQQDLIDSNPDAVENQKLLEKTREARQKAIDDRKTAVLEKRKADEEARKVLIANNLAKKNGTVSDNINKDGETTSPLDVKITKDAKTQEAKKTAEIKKTELEENRRKSLEERQKIINDRKKVAEEKRLKTLTDREATKKAKQDTLKVNK